MLSFGTKLSLAMRKNRITSGQLGSQKRSQCIATMICSNRNNWFGRHDSVGNEDGEEQDSLFNVNKNQHEGVYLQIS